MRRSRPHRQLRQFTDATRSRLCGCSKGHLAIAAAGRGQSGDVVLSWSFSTQSVDDTFAGVRGERVPAQPIAVQATGLTTKQVDPAGARPNIYVGTTQVPYYLTKPASTKRPRDPHDVLASPQARRRARLDQTSRNITRFNPMPAEDDAT